MKASNRRSSRESASRAASKVAAYLEEHDEDDDDGPYRMYKSPNKNDDEDFEIDGDSNSSDADSADEDADDDDDSFVRVRVEAGNVDVDASFLDADESGDEEHKENTGSFHPSLTLVQSIHRQVEQGDRKRDVDDTEGRVKDQTKSRHQTTLSSPHMPFCQSKTDAITMEPLPKKHICFYMPDQKTKQCFALETLHKIALTGTVIYVDEEADLQATTSFSDTHVG